jgi:hypothetical protein
MRKLLLIALFICFASFASAGPPITQGINTSAMGPISVTTLETSDDVDFILGATDNVTVNGSTTPHTDPDALLAISHQTATNLSKTFSTSLINTATTGGITWGQYNEVYSNAAVTGTSQSLYGNYTYVIKAGADTSPDTTTVYGGLFHGENTGATNVGTKDTYGLSAEAVGDTAGTSRTYGLYVSGTGADTNYGLYSASGTGIFVLDAGEQVYINATSTPQTQTEGALEIDVTTATDGVRAVDIDLSNTKTTGIGTTGMEINARSSAVVTSGNQSLYGAEIYATKSGADTNADATNVRGVNVQAQNTGSTAVGTRTTMGGYFSGTGDTAGTSTAYGIYATATGADTNYGIYSAAGRNYFAENTGIGLTSFGTSAAKVLGIASGTAPTTSPADAAQLYVADHNGQAGYARLHQRPENVTYTPASPLALLSELEMYKNPLAFAQGINLTASATVGGLSIADDADLGFGTSPFFLSGTVSLADYTPSAVVYIIYKVQDATHRYIFYVTTDGYLSLDLNGTIYKSSATLASVGVTDNYPAKFRADVTPGTTDTTVDFSVNGIALGTQQTAVNPGSATNTGVLYIMGTSTTRYAGTVYSIYAGNRAFTAAEFLSEYKNGIADAYKWGSQTAIYTSDFSAGANSWTEFKGTVAGNIDGIEGEDNVLRFYASADNSAHCLIRSITLSNYKKYRVSLQYYIPAGNTHLDSFKLCSNAGGALSDRQTTTGAWTTFTQEIDSSTYTGLRIYGWDGTSETWVGANDVADDLIYIKDFTVTPIDATLALESEGIQRDGWKDSSTNGLNASYPASGYSFLRPIRTDSAEGLLSVTNVSLAADADTTIYTVPTGKRLVLTKAILVVGADAGTSVISIGADGAETDWLPNNTLSAIDAANDAAILQPVPNTTPALVKSYAGGTVIQAKVSSHAGGATNSLSLFGYLY